MKALILYDSTGKIYNVIHGATEDDIPEGIPYLWGEVTNDSVIERIDVTDITKPFVVYSYPEGSKLGSLPDKLLSLQTELDSTKKELTEAKTMFDDTMAEITMVLAGLQPV